MPGSSFQGDTYLRLVNQAPVEVGASDDACVPNGVGSQIIYTATSSETFEIHAGCWSSTSCNGIVSWIIQ